MAWSGRRWKGSGHYPLGFDHSEPVTPQPPGLARPSPRAARGLSEAEQPAVVGLAIAAEVAAGHVEDRLDVEITFTPPQIAEGDALGVPQQPGGLMVQ